MPKSDVQQLRTRIELEIQAMHYGFQGIAIGVTRHQFIEARARHLGLLEEQLASYLGEDQASLFTCQAYIRLTPASKGAGHGK